MAFFISASYMQLEIGKRAQTSQRQKISSMTGREEQFYCIQNAQAKLGAYGK